MGVGASTAAFPYELQSAVAGWSDVRGWTLHDGRATSSGGSAAPAGTPVSIFRIRRAALDPLAANAVARMATLRHPNMVAMLAKAEVGEELFVVTERLRPLRLPLDANDDYG